MKTDYVSPLGKLSYIGHCELELILKGKHIKLLSESQETTSERVVMSIMSELAPGIDVYQMTMEEAYHAFLLVKVSSLGPILKTSGICQHQITARDAQVDVATVSCGESNEIQFSLADSDIVRCPDDYQIPEIEFETGGSVQTFTIRPPTMRQELDLFSYFEEMGIDRTKLLSLNDPKMRKHSYDYSLHRMLLHLHNKETGDTFNDPSSRKRAIKDIDENPVSFMKILSNQLQDQSRFGVIHKEIDTNCKRCGGRLQFRLGIAAGLSI